MTYPVCRSVLVYTEEKDKDILVKLEEKIRNSGIIVQKDDELYYYIGKPPNSKKVDVAFTSVEPNNCIIGKSTEVKILSENEEEFLKTLELDHVDKILTRAGCQLLQEGKNSRFYICSGNLIRAMPYKGGIWLSLVDKVEL